MHKQLIRIFIVAILACCLSTIEADIECDPKTFSLATFPAALRSITVIGTKPLTVSAHFVINNTAEEFIMTGMIYSSNFEDDHAQAACRSFGCSQLSSSEKFTWTDSTCRFECPDGTYAMRKCGYILRDFTCASDAMDLAECVSGSFWPSVYPNTFDYGVDLVCTECGGN